MRLSRTWLATLLLALAQPALADVVLDWNETGAKAVTAQPMGAAEGARILAMTHVAMYNAISAVQRRPGSYRFDARPDGEASAEAAGAAAARTVLDAMLPQHKEIFATAYQVSLQSLGSGPAIDRGVAIGEQAGRHCLEMRGKDGVGAPNLYRPVTTPGKYVPTMLPASFDWQKVTPWFLASPSQFRPEPPPALTSAVWARDYNEIKALGSKGSTQRTAEQTEIARFWEATLPPIYHGVVRSVATVPGREVTQNARLFMAVTQATDDALIAVFDAKYHYNFWRPVTAIRNGDIDGNDATEREPSWTPFIDTPMHPEYPCAHCIVSATVGTVLQAEIGTGPMPTLTTTSVTAKGAARSWTKIDDFMQEVANARIYDGVHYRNSTEVGTAMGKQIGELSAVKYLRPR